MLLLCSAAQKVKSSLMKISSIRASPRSSASGMVSFPLLSPLGLLKSFVIGIDVINTGYTIYFTICHCMCET
jgi:hypothetical protein